MTEHGHRANELDPLTFPLHGSRLIEASAGTGKTFTIALLYVRLVLAHGEVAEAGRRLTPREILVVTFTEAATKELRDRIRKRLTEAAGVFLADPPHVTDTAAAEGPLEALRASYPPEQWRSCARWLQLAAESMDEAAVHTIHGWCNRMLKEHAFDSGGLFNQALETDQSELMAQVVRDYWRTYVTRLDADTAAEYLAAIGSPEDLQKSVRELMALQAPLPASATPPEALLSEVVAERRALFDALRRHLPNQVGDFMAVFEQARAQKAVNGQKLKAPNLQGWLDKLLEWAGSEGLHYPELTDAAWNRLSPEGLEEAWKTSPAPTDHGLIRSLQLLAQDRDKAVPPELLKLHACHWISARLEREKQQRGELGFDDLLTRLDRALQQDDSGRLAATIRQQFPVAMVDEFQDTDPVQYRIFDAVYDVAASHRHLGFLMIGDPKQAIYRFRGADIHTYLAARRATEGRHVTLPRNYRSSSAQVDASNRVFAYAEAEKPGGAFGFAEAGKGNPLPFTPVSAKGRGDRFIVEGREPAAMTLWHRAGKANKDEVNQALAEACATEVTRLLNLGLAGQAGFMEGGVLRPLQAADVAILVNKGAEARLVRSALSARGVRSVYLSDRSSVLDTPQAVDVRHWLQACAEPERDRLVRAALATATLDLGWARLDGLRWNELAWEAEIEHFRRLHEIWQRQGVLAMIRRLLSDFQVPARLLATDEGERALTDILHVAELLQQESQQVDGEQALIRRLAEMIDQAGGQSEALQVRLESDADLVQVVTVHKSKGLEYPLVFLPFATSCRPLTRKDQPLVWHDSDGRAQLSFNIDESTLALADRERLGEDIRKLYVALTRARYATWVGAAELKGEERQSGLGYLLGLDRERELGEGLAALAEGRSEMLLQPLPEPANERYQPPPSPPLAPAREPERIARTQWWIASYSAIRYHQPEAEPAVTAGEPETPAAERLREEAEPAAAPSRPQRRPDPDERRIHGFFRGAEPGTFLHSLLEWCAEPAFNTLDQRRQELSQMVAQRCAARGWDHWAGPLTHWLSDLVATPLPLPPQPDGSAVKVALQALAQAVPELEFWFASDQVDTQALDRIVRAYTLVGMPAAQARPAADPMNLNGMLKGFIDLVFEHEGRYYVADYKSNFIGPDDAAYTPEAMAEVVAHKRYDLQYALYLLALHRLLRTRLPDYDYDRHIGGAVYLFLRGNGAASAGVHCDRPDRAMIEALDRLFRGQSDRMAGETGA
ncbi:MAG: exodeoxyribonuclease V subunit beta [Marinobacter sp.]|uniref:exodeoxyribonuclease V subunit beta n=1 Tax=Marinobacter sp. TaxID=50741 RepID=UPI00299EB941|nr:exodeoxyribonuclease V subunit beta [Marinobacter sp.]MDX1634572.1 exodeoxyribonuclease V subunit beta [Marinobacter sp.]